MSAGSLEVIDKLSHAIKNICKIIETYEEEEGYSSENSRGRNYSEEGGGSRTSRNNSYRGGSYDSSYEEEGGGSGRSNRGGSYARGRGRYAKRDSMGRYARAEDDMDDMVTELRGMMGDLPPEKQKEVQKFIQKIEQM